MADRTIYKPVNNWVVDTPITYYKMIGYYVAGDVYETYVVAASPTATPPSGHTLIDLAILATWQK